jgi:hypothetical protein
MKRKQDTTPTLPTTTTTAEVETKTTERPLVELSETDLLTVNAGVKWYEWSKWD